MFLRISESMLDEVSSKLFTYNLGGTRKKLKFFGKFFLTKGMFSEVVK